MSRFQLISELNQIQSIKTMNGKITSVKSSDFAKKGLRKFEGSQCCYFNYFGDISTTEFMNKSTFVQGASVELGFEYGNFQSGNFVCESTRRLNAEELGSKSIALERALEPFFDKFSFTGTYRTNQRKITLTDESGGVLESSNTELVHWYSIKRKGSPSIMDGYFWNSSFDLSPEYSVTGIGNTLEGFDRKAQVPPAGKYPVLFCQGDNESLLRRIMTSLVAEKYYKNSDLLAGKLGMRVFDERLTIVDANVNYKLGAFAPFDVEGFVRKQKDVALIENGIVKTIFADQRLANKYKTNPTGNATGGYNSAPQCWYHSVEIKPGARSTEDVLKSLPQCIIVMMDGGGSFNDSGDFSSAVEFCYLYEYGECIGRLEPVTVRSSMFEMFGKDLIEIASDNFFKSGASPSVFMNMDVSLN